jgi:hypothetical protein
MDAFFKYPFEDYKNREEQLMEELALRRNNHMEYYNVGLISSQNFNFDTMHDVYANNL